MVIVASATPTLPDAILRFQEALWRIQLPSFVRAVLIALSWRNFSLVAYWSVGVDRVVT